MGIEYEEAWDMQEIARDIIEKLRLEHVDLDNVAFLRSKGSSSRGTIARCHSLSKPLQLGLKRKGFYLIEVISERFDKLDKEEKIKVMIHELMHIPKTFGGGFIHHDKVHEKSINHLYQRYVSSINL